MRIGVGSVVGAVLCAVSCLGAPGISETVAAAPISASAQASTASPKPDGGASTPRGVVSTDAASAGQTSLNPDIPLNDSALLTLEQLEASIPVLEDRVQARKAEILTLREQRDQAVERVQSGKAAVQAIRKQLSAAVKSYEASRSKLERARSVRESAAEAQRKAREAAKQADADAAAADAAFTKATSERAAANASEDDIGRKLASLKYGSAAYRKAFAQWQNAAIAKHAAVARAVLAEERASSSAVGRAAVQEEMSEAGARYSQAQKIFTAAAVASADCKVAVATLTAESQAAESDLAKAEELEQVVAKDLAQMLGEQRDDELTISRASKQAAKIGEQLATAGILVTPSTPAAAAASLAPSPGHRSKGESLVAELTASTSATPIAPANPDVGPVPAAGKTYETAASPQPSDAAPKWRLVAAVAALVTGLAAAISGLWLLRRSRHELEAGA